MLRCDDAEITSYALRAGAGDRAATEAFVRGTQADVWRFVAHLAGDMRLADDLAHEAAAVEVQQRRRRAGHPWRCVNPGT